MNEQLFQKGSNIKQRRAQLLIRLFLCFGITFICLRSAASVIILTYAMAGQAGIVVIVSYSMIYGAVVAAIAEWDWIAGGALTKHLTWIKELPRYLPLGAVAVFLEMLFAHTETEMMAYPLRVLIIVFALMIPFSCKRLLLELSLPGTNEETTGTEWYGERIFSCIRVGERRMHELPNMGDWSWSLLLAGHVIECVIWTFLIIEYRYFRDSFLGQSPWIMASLWIFLASCWMRCLTMLAEARAGNRSTHSGGRRQSGRMRFRAQTSRLPWLLVAFLCVYVFDASRSKSFYSSLAANCVAVLILSVLLNILCAIFTYWELDTVYFRQRKLWKVKVIAWQDVTRIQRVGFSNRGVMINYGRVPEDCGYIIVNPSSRNEFIDALRGYVPHAEFDV